MEKVMRASSVGFPCDTALWYQVNGEESVIANPRILDVGSALEATIVNWLRLDGWEVSYNPGSQNADLELNVAVNGGIISGHPDCWISRPGMENVLVDIKTMNERSYTQWKRNGTEKDKPQYVDQVHVYAEGAMNLGLPVERLGIVGVNKNNSDLFIDFFDFNPDRMSEIIRRTEYIFASDFPPEPGDRIQKWCCRYCGYSHLCEFVQGKKDTHVDDGIMGTNDPNIVNAMELLKEARELSKTGEDLENEAKAVLDKEVRQQGIKSVRGGSLILTLAETTSNRFDSKTFRKDYPDMAKAYTRVINSVTYNLKEAV